MFILLFAKVSKGQKFAGAAQDFKGDFQKLSR